MDQGEIQLRSVGCNIKVLYQYANSMYEPVLCFNYKIFQIDWRKLDFSYKGVTAIYCEICHIFWIVSPLVSKVSTGTIAGNAPAPSPDLARCAMHCHVGLCESIAGPSLSTDPLLTQCHNTLAIPTPTSYTYHCLHYRSMYVGHERQFRALRAIATLISRNLVSSTIIVDKTRFLDFDNVISSSHIIIYSRQIYKQHVDCGKLHVHRGKVMFSPTASTT